MPVRQGRSPGWSSRMAATRDTIVETAVRLFVERGFDDVTIASIATAAGVSERTVYRYFPAKEDLVLERGEFGAFLDALDAHPPDVAPLPAIAATIREAATSIVSVPVEVARIELILATPSLHAAWIASLADFETALRTWLAQRSSRSADDVDVVVAAAALVGTHRVLVETWGGGDLATYAARAERALDLLAAGLDSVFD